jgi:hypothetical protein
MRISRRDLIGWAGGTLLTSRLLHAAGISDMLSGGPPKNLPPGPTRWQSQADQQRQLTAGITWLTHEPIEFIIRRDGDHPGLARQYQAMCDPENIKRMADAGVRWGRIFFYKGFGLQFEKAHMDITRRVADQMHGLGMKVSLYVGGTMFTETLYKEIPQAQDWEQRDSFNRPVPYGNQTYRHFACPNEPAYRDYIKRVLNIAVNDFYADELAFDNFVLQDEPRSCRCRRCMKAFTEFLAPGILTRIRSCSASARATWKPSGSNRGPLPTPPANSPRSTIPSCRNGRASDAGRWPIRPPICTPT